MLSAQLHCLVSKLFNHFSIPSINRASCAAVKTPQGEMTKPKLVFATP
jgi:hypothetical protein